MEDQQLILAFYMPPNAGLTRHQLPEWLNDKIDASVIALLRRFVPQEFTSDTVIVAPDALFAALGDLPEARARAAGLEIADAIRKELADAGVSIR